MIEISVLEYYNKPSFYQFMPEVIFSALEKAYLAGSEFASVPKTDFERMIKQSENGN